MFSFVLEGDGSILMSNVMLVFSASIAYCILIISQKVLPFEIYVYFKNRGMHLCLLCTDSLSAAQTTFL